MPEDRHVLWSLVAVQFLLALLLLLQTDLAVWTFITVFGLLDAVVISILFLGRLYTAAFVGNLALLLISAAWGVCGNFIPVCGPGIGLSTAAVMVADFLIGYTIWRTKP